MAAYNDRDFQGMAERVVDSYLAGQSKLADAAAAEAKTGELNPDQIERMVQAANVMTFQKLMDQRKSAGATDLMHEFDPIDSRQIIKILIDQNGVHVDGPTSMNEGMGDMSQDPGMDDLPDEMSGIRMNPAEGDPGHMDSPAVEECEEECHDKLDPPGVKTKKKGPPDKKKEAGIMRARKLASLLEDQRLQEGHRFDERLDRLSMGLRRIYGPGYLSFEKDAMMEHGDDPVAVEVINLLRRERKLEPVQSTQGEKLAAERDHYLSVNTTELRQFEELVKIAHEALKLEQGARTVKEQWNL